MSSPFSLGAVASLSALNLCLAACTRRESSENASPRNIALTDVTAEAGIRFHHEAGARGEMLNPETFGPGAGWLDYDNDGRPDLLLVNGNSVVGELDPKAHASLYRNLGGGRFLDATAETGLDRPLYGMGFVSGDVDNDGDQDLLIYGLRRSLFLVNEGGKFRETTEPSGLAALRGWVGAATFLDYDLDGVLDLFAGNYVDWSRESELAADCTFGTGVKRYCPVAVFPPSAPQLFRGRGDATFVETTVPAGLAKVQAKALGVAVEDFDRDGFPDVFVACDTVPNLLLRNRGDGTFEDRGLESGFAVGADGAAFAGMGIDSAWLPDGEDLVLVIGNFSGEPTTLHVEESGQFFVEKSMTTGLGRATLDRVTFGVALQDFDLDGELDLAVANGHVFDVEKITGVPYRQRPQVFLGRDWKKLEGLFEEASPTDPSHFLNRAILGRALATADFDGDGDLDLVVTENQGGAILLRNDLPEPRLYVRIDLQGTRSNRDAFGAEVTLRIRRPSGTTSLRRTRKAVSSYLSQPERKLTYGLGKEDAACDAEVLWPSRLRELFRDIPRNRDVLLVEGKGEPADAGRPAREATAPAGGTSGKAGSVPERRRGLEHLEAMRWNEAARALSEAVRLDPDDLTSRRALLTALSKAGRPTEARTLARETASRFRDANLLVTHFAIVLGEGGQLELSELFFGEALKLDPKRYDAAIALANLAFDRKDYDEADRRYKKALEIDAGSVEALTNIGKTLTLRKDYAAAKPWLEKALLLRPDYAAALSTLGGICIEERDWVRAEELLTKALVSTRSTETRITAYGNLGILHARRKDRPRAIECFEKVLELRPGDAQAREALDQLRR